MSTLAEIESAVAALPRIEKVQLMDSLKRMIETPDRALRWPVPPPNVPREELQRIQAEIDAAFSKVG